ncbi:MAG: hypothetical protein AAB657_05030 [Patescibacteria group bacterium]
MEKDEENKIPKIVLTPLTDSEKRRVKQLESGRVEPCSNIISDTGANCFMGRNPSTGKLPHYADPSRKRIGI